jgi:putative oxidoreductase
MERNATLSLEEPMATRSTDSLTSYGLGLLRIIASFTFLCHGLQKLFGLFGGHKAQIFSLFGLAGCLETIGGILLLMGLFTRPVAFVLCGEMAFAYFTAHFPHGPLPIINQGELAVLYCFIFLLFALAGPGYPSVDANVRKP